MLDLILAHESLIVTLVAIAVLLVLSAFFSGSETALTAASLPRLHQLALTGNRRAQTVRRLRGENETLIGAILIGNNITNIWASALATSVLIALFGETGVIYATIAMTVLVVIFAEVLPKTYAINNPDRAALAVAPIIRVVVWVFKPFSQAVRMIVRGALDLFGVAVTQDYGHRERAEELRGLIEMHRGPGLETGEERAMLRSVLDLGTVWVQEVMTYRRNVMMINADLDIETILREATESPFTRIPLYHGDQEEIVGVLHVKQLLRALRAHGAHGAHGGKDDDPAPINIDALAYAPWFIPESTTLLDQLRAFRVRREHFALVVDEYGTFQGVVTLEDILEEIVGEIDDENDVEHPGLSAQADGSCLVSGTVTIRDLNRELDWSLPDDGDAATVAGLVLHEARTIPETGQEFLFHGHHFKILGRHRNQITRIRVWKIDPDGHSASADN